MSTPIQRERMMEILGALLDRNALHLISPLKTSLAGRLHLFDFWNPTRWASIWIEMDGAVSVGRNSQPEMRILDGEFDAEAIVAAAIEWIETGENG